MLLLVMFALVPLFWFQLVVVEVVVVVKVVEASGKSRFPRVYESRHLHVFIKLSLSFFQLLQ